MGLFLLPQFFFRIISRLLYYLGWSCAIYTGHFRTRVFILPKTSKVVWPITCMYCTSTNHGAREGEIYRERSKRCKYTHVLCRWFLCTIWLCCSMEQPNLLVRLARGELPPRLSLVSPKVFFSVLSPMEFWFLAAVASGMLSWEHNFQLYRWLDTIFLFNTVKLLWHNLYC